MENTNTEIENRKMSFEQIARILNYQQRLSARTAITRSDRKKTSLTPKELFNRYAQMGNVLRYKDITFTVKDGMGQLTIGNHGVWGATIGDFHDAVVEKYGYHIKQLEA